MHTMYTFIILFMCDFRIWKYVVNGATRIIGRLPLAPMSFLQFSIFRSLTHVGCIWWIIRLLRHIVRWFCIDVSGNFTLHWLSAGAVQQKWQTNVINYVYKGNEFLILLIYYYLIFFFFISIHCGFMILIVL